jgi:hypothetical protein
LEKNAVFGTIDFSERLGAPALRLERACVRDVCGDMAGYKFEEAAIAVI